MAFAAYYEPPLEEMDRRRGLLPAGKLKLVPETRPRRGSVHAVTPSGDVACGKVALSELVDYEREWGGILGSAACRACVVAVARSK